MYRNRTRSASRNVIRPRSRRTTAERRLDERARYYCDNSREDNIVVFVRARRLRRQRTFIVFIPSRVTNSHDYFRVPAEGINARQRPRGRGTSH